MVYKEKFPSDKNVILVPCKDTLKKFFFGKRNKNFYVFRKHKVLGGSKTNNWSNVKPISFFPYLGDLFSNRVFGSRDVSSLLSIMSALVMFHVFLTILESKQKNPKESWIHRSVFCFSCLQEGHDEHSYGMYYSSTCDVF